MQFSKALMMIASSRRKAWRSPGFADMRGVFGRVGISDSAAKAELSKTTVASGSSALHEHLPRDSVVGAGPASGLGFSA